jgi:uncharacterized alkaline shock family protein YloU
MSNDRRPPGKTTVSPQVLMAIARMAALSVPGVKSLAPASGSVERWFRTRASDGVRLTMQENVIHADLYLVVKDGVNIREVGRDVQQQVTRAIQEMVGMDIARIDIHVENIAFEGAEA